MCFVCGPSVWPRESWLWSHDRLEVNITVELLCSLYAFCSRSIVNKLAVLQLLLIVLTCCYVPASGFLCHTTCNTSVTSHSWEYPFSLSYCYLYVNFPLTAWSVTVYCSSYAVVYTVGALSILWLTLHAGSCIKRRMLWCWASSW